jgi:RimJ/RimL family protein N-acetyltransferase
MITETQNLQIKEFVLEDAPFILELLNTPGWLQYIGDRNVKKTEDAEIYLQNGPFVSYKNNGFGLWNVVLKETNTSIGMCGLINRDTLDHPDIGFAFLPAYAGKGYGYEAATATLEYAVTTLGMDKIFAITLPENIASVKLLQKLGLAFDRDIQMGEETLMLFSTKAE